MSVRRDVVLALLQEKLSTLNLTGTPSAGVHAVETQLVDVNEDETQDV